ncbi:MAG TPA: GTPase HflX, partial [Jatrophihabitantaceae bacterium]|nr:GTPase HflX [Jatrophihabitantaceae bacterium]
PHQLVEAFRSTLEEVSGADLILHVVDAADADPEAQIRAVREVFAEVNAGGVPEQLVFNKVDAADPDMLARLRRLDTEALFVSATTGAGIEELRGRIDGRLPRPDSELTVLVPYARGDLVARIHADGEVLASRHVDTGTLVSARVNRDLAAALQTFVAPLGVRS